MSSSDETVKISPFFFPKKLSNINVALALLCLGIIGQSMMVSGALNVSISTIEREFHYNSFQVAFIDTAYNISFAVCAIIIGYIITTKKMRWIGTGLLFISLGCLLFIIPVFIKKYETMGLADTSLLCKNVSTENIHEEICHSGSKIYLVIMCLAYCLIGVGAAPLHTLAVSYINENNNRKDGGLYNGIYYAAAAFGPVITFVLYSLVIKIPIRNNQQNNFLTPESENWIGAYWLLYIIGCVLTFCTSIPMCLFPSIIKTNFKIRKQTVVPPKITFSRFLKITKTISRNTPYIFICIGMFFDGMMNNAFGVFMAKYIEAQFRIPSGKAALFAGAIMVLGATLGLFCGGLLIKKFNWSNKVLINRIVFLSLLGACCLAFLFLRCPNSDIHGVAYTENSVLNFTTTCAHDCNCATGTYFPVCADGEKTYYSPCAIGCQEQKGKKGELEFSNCICVDDIYKDRRIIQGACSTGCKNMIIFLLLGFVCLVVEFIIYIPQITFTIGISHEGDTGLTSLSLQQMLLRISYMLGPLLLSPLLDYSCVFFNPATNCAQTTNCINYDLKKLSYVIAIPSISCKLLATLFLFFAALSTRTTSNPPDL
ncbi:hypothetical protein HZS_7561, partial [Henneguya salminicola]